MEINYEPIGWNTTKYVNPSNMNHMDAGIKAACDGVDAANENLLKRHVLTLSDITIPAYSSETYNFKDYVSDSVCIWSAYINNTNSASSQQISVHNKGNNNLLIVNHTANEFTATSVVLCIMYE